MATLTAANSAFSLAITNLYPVPQILQGFATDDAFAAEAIDLAEIQMGVDGRMSSAYVPNPTPITINLQADSPSLIVFETWLNATRGDQEIYSANGTIMFPATGRKYNLRNGVLTRGTPFSGVKKTLQPSQFVITFESVVGGAL